jgi:hypothetical protein
MPIRNEYISYVGSEQPNMEKHDGGLRPVVGAWNVQVVRANRAHPEMADGVGNTYNHAPNLTYWHNQFYLAYLSNPVSEHLGAGQTFLCTSPDALHFTNPQSLFPPYPLNLSLDNGPQQDLFNEGDCACMHQRMSFYIAPNDRLLACGYYGLSPEVPAAPCRGIGIGRVVREIFQDGSFGPIFFILYNTTTGYNRETCIYPYFEDSKDAGFVQACRDFLADKLTVLQWFEENRDAPSSLFAISGAGEAFNYYPLADGRLVGLWKKSRVAISADGGQTWSAVKKSPSLVMSGAKVWGEHTKDGRYALAYNPITDSTHRWPLAIVTGENGLDFENMLCVHGQVPPQRYWGFWRDAGQQYVRGLEAGASAPDDAMYLTYSVNKEDIWVSRIPLPVAGIADAHVNDDFASCKPRGFVPGWHIYSGVWSRVSLECVPRKDDEKNKALRLRHKDPCHEAVAIRVFPCSERLRIRTRIQARQNYFGRLEIDLCDSKGAVAYRVILDSDRTVKLKHGNGFSVPATYGGAWMDLEWIVDCYEKTVTFTLDGKDCGTWFFFNNLQTVERMVFRTGKQRREPYLDEDAEFMPPKDYPNSDTPLSQEAIYYIDHFSTEAI